MKNKIIILSLISIIFFSVNTLSGCTDNQNNNIDDGEDFKFQGLDGSIYHLSEYRGKIVILDMWATWCQPCGLQMIELEKLYNHYDKEKIEIISLDIETRETIEMVNQYINEFKKYNDWVFGMDVDNVWEKYKINDGIPTLYIFDQDGHTYYKHEGVSVFSEIPEGWPQTTIKLKDKIDEII